jgi:TatD DNase family protein
MRLIDSHCHLDDERFSEDIEAVIERALAAGVERMMSIGTGDGPPDLEVAIRLADRFDCVYATVGVHPHDAAKADGSTIGTLEKLLGHPKVLAIGEIGLDYHYNHSPADVQKRVFQEQLELASTAGYPIVIHTREAWPDTFDFLERYWSPVAGGILHCFSGGPDEARRAVAMGLHVSFSGIVTYPKSIEVQEAAKIVPLDRLLVETDAPYLAPTPHRGKRNEPSFVGESLKKVALLRNEPVESVGEATCRNWERLCVLPHAVR